MMWHGGVRCGVVWCGVVGYDVACQRMPGRERFCILALKNKKQQHLPWGTVLRYPNGCKQSEKGQGQRTETPFNCCYAVCVLQKHGLKVHLRDPYSFTPMLEEGLGSKVPRSLLLGMDMAENQKQIAQFSRKDAQVGKGPAMDLLLPCQPVGGS